MIEMDVQTGHVVIVGVAVVCGSIMVKVTKKIIGAAIVICVVVAATKYFGLW